MAGAWIASGAAGVKRGSQRVGQVGTTAEKAPAEVLFGAMGALQKFDLAAFTEAHMQSMQELQEQREENLRLRKQIEEEAASFAREREAFDEQRHELDAQITELHEDHHAELEGKESLGREKERQTQNKEALESRLIETRLEAKRLEEQLKKRTDAIRQGKLDAEALREKEQFLRAVEERLSQQTEHRLGGESRIHDLEQQLRVLSEHLEEAHVVQRRLKDKMATLDEERRQERDGFDKMRRTWECQVAQVDQDLAEERKTRKVRNLAPLAKVIRLEGILPRSTLLKSLEPESAF